MAVSRALPEPLYDILSRPAPEAFEGFMVRWHGMVPGEQARGRPARVVP